MENENASITLVVDEIWQSYDLDGTNKLNKFEAKKFIEELLPDMKAGHYLGDNEFNRLFKEFDTDGDGTIDKAEMTNFIKRALNNDEDEEKPEPVPRIE